MRRLKIYAVNLKITQEINSKPKIKCPLCMSVNWKIYELKYPFFCHHNFEVIRSAGRIGECHSCGLLANIDNLENPSIINAIYTNKKYVQTRKSDHYVSVPEFEEPVSQYYLQAQLLKKYLPNNPAILDIGCFDGKLLREFHSSMPGARLCGFDVDEQRRSLIPKPITFISKDLNRIEQKFDLICLSHSIQYILDIRVLFEKLVRLLNNDGNIFVQVPNLMKNHYALLYGDLHYYYTPEILKRIFSKFRFEFHAIDQQGWFTRDILGMAKQTIEYNESSSANSGIIDSCLAHFDKLKQNLWSIRGSKVGILGTTINAGFAASIINSVTSFFVDENPTKKGTFFLGKPIIHPELLKEYDIVVLPYGDYGKGIQLKFNEKYKGRFILL